MFLKRPWCWERLRAGGEGGNRKWDGWMASLTQWIWVWANSGRWWRIRKPGVLQSMAVQKVGPDSATEQQQKVWQRFIEWVHKPGKYQGQVPRTWSQMTLKSHLRSTLPEGYLLSQTKLTWPVIPLFSASHLPSYMWNTTKRSWKIKCIKTRMKSLKFDWLDQLD